MRMPLHNLPQNCEFFCALKTQANYGDKLKWDEIQSALNTSVRAGCLTEEQHSKYNAHMESQVLKELRHSGVVVGFSSRHKTAVEELCKNLEVSPKSVMA